MTIFFLDNEDYDMAAHRNQNETSTLYQTIEPSNEDPIVVNHTTFFNDPFVANSSNCPPKWYVKINSGFFAKI